MRHEHSTAQIQDSPVGLCKCTETERIGDSENVRPIASAAAPHDGDHPGLKQMLELDCGQTGASLVL